MSKIRVLETIRQGQIGGGESHLIDLIDGLSDNIEPVVLSFTDGFMIDYFREGNVKTHIIPTLKPFDYKVWKEIKSFIIDEKIDIVHTHGTRSTTNVLWPARQLKMPIIYTVHGWSFHQDQSALVRRVRTFSEGLLTRFSTRVINVSETNRQTGKKLFKLNNAVVIQNGINIKRFNPDKTYKNIRKELGIDEKTFLIGYCARITIQKDPETFIKAVDIIHKKEPAIKVLMIGDGDLKEMATGLIREYQLEDVIISQDFRLDIPDVLKAVDVYCLPSLWEGLSLSLLEAMSMKKAVVATPTDGTVELIQDGVNGFLVPFKDPEKLADALLKYYYNKELIVEHGEYSRNLVKNNFDAAIMCDKVEQIYNELYKKKHSSVIKS
nr:glycosyltransferase family 4 protein [Bacteroidota bacterium]